MNDLLKYLNSPRNIREWLLLWIPIWLLCIGIGLSIASVLRHLL